MIQTLTSLHAELDEELKNILHYWMKYTIDGDNGGFYGSVLNDNTAVENAAKGVVLNARILWTFSAAFNYKENKEYLTIAGRARDYLLNHFFDKEFGGVYWSVDAKGTLLEGKKQIYGLAFCIYGLSEYYAATKDETALHYCIELFNSIEKYSYDPLYKGYFEAFSREWNNLPDLRLSAKDANEKKTMNTHLHIIEAYANLYKSWPDEIVKNRIVELLFLFDKYFINSETGHLRLFFDEQWIEKVDVISYGHDIEAAWLLLQGAEIIKEEVWINKFKAHAITIANAAMRGLDIDGGLWYEYDQKEKHLIKEKHWWPQAEAMVGFFNAFEITNNKFYLNAVYSSWKFTKQYIIDTVNGEWYWGVTADYSIMKNQDKAGFWKCPYHNGRACLELLQRINKLLITKPA